MLNTFYQRIISAAERGAILDHFPPSATLFEVKKRVQIVCQVKKSTIFTGN